MTLFIFIQEKEADKSDKATAARGVAQAEDVSVFFITLHCNRSQILSILLLTLERLDQLFLEFHETEIKLLIIFLCDYFVMILYQFIFIFIQEKEAEKSDQATAARGVAQAGSKCFFYYTPLSQITEHYLTCSIT